MRHGMVLVVTYRITFLPSMIMICAPEDGVTARPLRSKEGLDEDDDASMPPTVSAMSPKIAVSSAEWSLPYRSASTSAPNDAR